LVGAFGQSVALQVNLQVAGLIPDVGKAGLAHDAPGHQPAGDANLKLLFLQLGLVKVTASGYDFGRPMLAPKIIRVRLTYVPKLRQFGSALFDLFVMFRVAHI
jgi:hypothetical protein